MANSIAQQNALFEKYSKIDFIDITSKVATIKEISKLTFSREVVNFLADIVSSYPGDMYLPDQDAPARTALAILATKMHLVSVRDFISSEASETFNSNMTVRQFGAPYMHTPSWSEVACAEVMRRRAVADMIAAGE